MNKTKSNTWKIYMLTGISFLNGTSQFAFGGILDKVAASAGVSVSTAGQLTTAYSLAGAIGTPIVMMAAARVDRRRLQLLSLTTIFVSMVMTFALPGFGFLIASRILFGIGFGVYGVSTYSIVTKMAPPGREARALSNLAMGSSAALVIGVPISRVIAAAYDWRSIFWVISFFTLLGIIANYKLIPATEGEAPIPLLKQLSLLKKPRISVALLVTFFMFVSYSVVNTYTTPFLIFIVPKIEKEMSIILFGLGVASLIGSKLGGSLADRIGAGRTLVGGMIVQTIALLLIPVVPGSAIFIITILMIWAIAAWTCGPTFSFNLISIAPEASGIILSLNSTFVQLGFAAGASIGGIAAGSSSIMSIILVGAVSVAMATFTAAIAFGQFKSVKSHKEKYSSKILED
jgi:DHA1 family putative efflux transporter-like MFS transporter